MNRTGDHVGKMPTGQIATVGGRVAGKPVTHQRANLNNGRVGVHARALSLWLSLSLSLSIPPSDSLSLSPSDSLSLSVEQHGMAWETCEGVLLSVLECPT